MYPKILCMYVPMTFISIIITKIILKDNSKALWKWIKTTGQLKDCWIIHWSEVCNKIESILGNLQKLGWVGIRILLPSAISWHQAEVFTSPHFYAVFSCYLSILIFLTERFSWTTRKRHNTDVFVLELKNSFGLCDHIIKLHKARFSSKPREKCPATLCVFSDPEETKHFKCYLRGWRCEQEVWSGRDVGNQSINQNF